MLTLLVLSISSAPRNTPSRWLQGILPKVPDSKLWAVCFVFVCYLFLLSASFIHSPHSHTIVLCYRIHWNLHPLQEYLLSNLNHMYYIIIYLPCTLWSRRILYRQCILPNPITFIEISSVVLFFRSFFPQISILVYHF